MWKGEDNIGSKITKGGQNNNDTKGGTKIMWRKYVKHTTRIMQINMYLKHTTTMWRETTIEVWKKSIIVAWRDTTKGWNSSNVRGNTNINTEGINSSSVRGSNNNSMKRSNNSKRKQSSSHTKGSKIVVANSSVTHEGKWTTKKNKDKKTKKNWGPIGISSLIDEQRDT
jgi:hypothetical protein